MGEIWEIVMSMNLMDIVTEISKMGLGSLLALDRGAGSISMGGTGLGLALRNNQNLGGGFWDLLVALARLK
jgi:hypothetical protein